MGLFLSRLATLFVAVAGTCTIVVAVPQVASAVNFFGDACKGSGADSAACSTDTDDISGPDGIILRVAGLVALIAGVAAVIVIMVGAVMFVTADGDSGKLSNARKTIAYAVVGLIVIVLARTVVVFVINNV